MIKTVTGIEGFDGLTHGGLPQGRSTLVEGSTGSGKTVFSLQSLVHGARELGEPGIFVAFEEDPQLIRENARSFGWNIDQLDDTQLFFLDARPDLDLVRSGEFDIVGMLAGLESQIKAMGAKRIVFDAIDMVLGLTNDPVLIRHEVHRLHRWLVQQNMTSLLTLKLLRPGTPLAGLPALDFVQFMVDCAVQLDHDFVDGVSQRSVRVYKYRGSGFEENSVPMMISDNGIEVAYTGSRRFDQICASAERLSTGIAELDEMLGGGYFRNAGVLLTGSPGTAKTTLCGAFAEASCKRGDNTLFVSFDSSGDEIVRNLASVGIDLASAVESGRLQMLSLRGLSGNAESHLLRICQAASKLQARCVIVDPLSAMGKAGNRYTAPAVAERLADWAKTEGITLLCSSLLDNVHQPIEGTPLQISTIADTWIHLSYVINAGERNRALSIVKSRGTGHSNQVRELVMSDDGVSLAEVYYAGGEVLMGSMRWARERADELEARQHEVEHLRQQSQLRAEELALESQIETLTRQLDEKRLQSATVGGRADERLREDAATRQGLRDRRQGSASASDRERDDEH